MNIAFLMNLARTPAPSSARSHRARPSFRRMRQIAAASLSRAWNQALRALTDAPGMKSQPQWHDYLRALAVSGICTAIAWPLLPHFGLVNVVMLYLLGTTVGALRLGRGPIVALATTNMLAFDYFFVPPVFSFDVEDTRYLFTLGVMLIVALVIANLMVSIRRHREVADTLCEVIRRQLGLKNE